MKSVRAEWRTVLLVCRKCSRKIGGGFGEKGRTSLARVIRDDALLGKGRKAAAGVVEIDCVKVCPKRGVVVIDTADPRRWMVVAPGESIAGLIARLGDDPAA